VESGGASGLPKCLRQDFHLHLCRVARASASLVWALATSIDKPGEKRIREMELRTADKDEADYKQKSSAPPVTADLIGHGQLTS
jgi:hypothetical protein